MGDDLDEIELRKYLGMAVYMIYYHHDRLHQKNTFPDNYWDQLMGISNFQDMSKMKDYLEYALSTSDYCLNLIESPNFEFYSIGDIRLFFEKFHSFLKKSISMHES